MQARTASSACGKTTTSRPGMRNRSLRAATTSSKMATLRAARGVGGCWSVAGTMERPGQSPNLSEPELGGCEHGLEQLVDLADHPGGGVARQRGERDLDLVEVLELAEQLDVGQLAAGGQEVAD